jgi:hypothetical protein
MSIKKACENAQKGLIVTQCFDVELDIAPFNQWLNVLSEFGGDVAPIYLDVSVPELKKRVTNESRLGTNKVQCPLMLDEVINKYKFGPIPHPDTFIIKSENLTVSETTQQIKHAICW